LKVICGWIEPLVNGTAAAGYDKKLRPVLVREPLEQAENNLRRSLALDRWFGRFRLETSRKREARLLRNEADMVLALPVFGAIAWIPRSAGAVEGATVSTSLKANGSGLLIGNSQTNPATRPGGWGSPSIPRAARPRSRRLLSVMRRRISLLPPSVRADSGFGRADPASGSRLPVRWPWREAFIEALERIRALPAAV
jgi:hypothetical protein